MLGYEMVSSRGWPKQSSILGRRTSEKVAQALGLPLEHVLAGFRKLAEYDLIVWKEGEARLLSAYPFSGVWTAHQVLTDAGKALYAMCAIDALGIPFMLGQGASVRSACFFCQQPVQVDIAGGLLQRAHPSTITVWFSERDGCCVAEARCPLMNFFCTEEHLQAWLAKSSNEPGTSLSLMEALEVGKAAFGELLK
jgi:Alkylmercury lyase